MSSAALPQPPAPLAPPSFALVVACDSQRGIGREGDLAWRLPADLKWFRAITVGDGEHAVLMGRKTWDSIPERFRPLPGRLNLVLSRQPKPELPVDVLHATSLAQGLSQLSDRQAVFVIGGGTIYAQALELAECKRVYLTEVDGTFDCDTFLPEWGPEWRRTQVILEDEHEGIRFRFVQLDRD